MKYAYREAVTHGRYTFKLDDIWVYDEYKDALYHLQTDRMWYEANPEYSVQVVADDHFFASDGEACIERFITNRNE